MNSKQVNLQKMKEDLSVAVKTKNIPKIEEISRILNISDEQKKYFEKGLTGYPSIDKVWLNFYPDGTEERVNNIPEGKTIWDVIYEKLLEYYDIPAIEYFGKVFSRQEFIDSCYTWAKTFKAMGVEEGEIVPVYGVFVPDICAMFFALNMIGACPYFLKLAMSPQALAEETKDTKIAIVLDSMWPYVAHEFSKDKFKNVVVATATADMPSPKKEIVSFKSKIQSLKSKCKIPDDKKYIWCDKAKDIANYYSGEVNVPFKSGRRAIITSSSGTTGGIVKGTVATNESVLTQVFSTTYSDILYEPGMRTLNHFPPTAATSLNALFLVGLVNGATILVDPRTSEKAFYNQLVNLKPNICINTGTLWKTFFYRISKEIESGKKFDFNYAKGWMIGGDGIFSSQIKKWDNIMKECGGGRIIGGYGFSENFTGVCYDRIDMPADYSKPMMSSGLIQVGMIPGIYDEDGNELSYNQRGQLKVKSGAIMKEYYGKPDLTAQVIENGTVKSGDLAEIDEKGFMHIWGRNCDVISCDGEKKYLFDVAYKIMANDFLEDAVVLSMPTIDNENNLVAHIVWSSNVSEEDKKRHIMEINSSLKDFLPEGFVVSAYAEHDGLLPYSPTTLKQDKPNMSRQVTGYVQVVNGQMNNIEFILQENGKYLQQNNGEVKKKKIKRK